MRDGLIARGCPPELADPISRRIVLKAIMDILGSQILVVFVAPAGDDEGSD